MAIELSITNLSFMNNTNDNQIGTVKDTADRNCAIAAEGVMKTYSSMMDQNKEAVKGISFTAQKQSCYVILGTNGAGKSTLFKCMTGEVAPTQGDVFVGGSSICNQQADARSKIG